MKKYTLFLTFFTGLLIQSLSFAYEGANNQDISQAIAKSSYVKSQKKLEKNPIQTNPRPYWAPLSSLEKKGSVFFQPNVGLGLLYFHQVRGNLTDNPNYYDPNITSSMPSLPYKRGLSYNKTLVKDFVFGYRVFDWFKVGLSYQNQSGIFIYSQPLPYITALDGNHMNAHVQLASYLSLNSLMAKTFFEIPHALIYKKIAFAPFFALGVGAGWQSWFPSRNRYNGNNDNEPVVQNPKIIPNVTFMVDKGLRFQPAKVNPSYSGILGFKFMLWGQARSLYKIQQQGSLKSGIFKPFNIKTIYSLIPYLGLQWNFAASRLDYLHHKKVYSSEFDSFFIHSKYTVKPKNFITQFNLGPNFLYFSGIDGNLAITPLEPSRFFGRNIPSRKKFKYNRVPLYEYLLGYRLTQNFQFGLSLQTSSYNVLQTPYVQGYASETAHYTQSQFKSYLNLYALMAKAYFYLPYAFRAGFISFNYYLAAGFGPSWQSWYNAQVNSVAIDSNNLSIEAQQNFSAHPKIIANPSMMVDMGFDMKNAHPDALFHIYLGIRYNLWGQIRNLGKLQQQPYKNNGLLRPVKVKTLYSWTPYLSFQWDFPLNTGEYLAKQYTNTWKPYWASLKECDQASNVFFQGNIGPNFLRFSGVSGNLGRRPTLNENKNLNAPYKGRLSKNNPLLFEFMTGYKFNYGFKCALSLQSQTAVYICSKAIPTQFDNDLFSATAQFQSQLQLYSLMLKPYLELPSGLVFKNWIWSPYIGMGIGASWQSWNNNTIYEYADEDNNVYPYPLTLTSKTSASVAWMVDLGFKTRHVSPLFNGAVVVGVKYNQWGQARNIGELSQQWNTMRVGLLNAFRIKTVYSFAPYLGFQWNF